MKDKKEKATPLLAILKELIVEKGFDPALMEEPFFIDQINTIDKDKRVYSKDEANYNPQNEMFSHFGTKR